MSNARPPYRDYLDDRGVAVGAPLEGPVQHRQPHVLVQGHADGTWIAVHQSGDGLLGSLDSGARDEVIAWAEARCSDIFIYEPDLGDYVDLYGSGRQP